jgi:hypothetical protein
MGAAKGRYCRMESFILKQIHFSVNNNDAIRQKYIGLRPKAVQQFQKVNCLKMAK